MATPPTLVDAAFAGGVDQSTRDEVVDPLGSFLVLENGRQDKRGGYYKRYGYSVLTNTQFGSTSRTAGYKIVSHRDTLAVIDGASIDVYDAGALQWRTLGRLPECTAKILDAPSVGTDGLLEDIEYCNGYFAYAWRSELGSIGVVWASLVNATTGAVVRVPEAVFGGAAQVRVLLASYSTYFIAIIGDVFNTDIVAYYLNTASAATIHTGWVSMGTMATDVPGPTTVFSVQSLTDKVAFAYVNDSAGASRATVKTLTIAGVLQTQTLSTSSVTPGYIDVAGSSTDTLWIAWNEATAVKVRGQSPTDITTTLATAATLITTAGNPGGIWIAASSVAGKGRLFVNDVGATAFNVRQSGFQTSGGAAATDGGTWTVPNVGCFGRPKQYGGRYYAQVYYEGESTANTQKCLFLVDATNDETFFRPVANPVPSLGVKSFQAKGKIVAGPVASTLHFGINVTRSSVIDASALVACDFGSTNRWQAVGHNRSTFLSGGVVTAFDGVRVTEAGFLVSPTKPTTATSGTGITCSTGWRYVAVFEDVDANGNWIVSGLSAPSTSTGAVANKTVSVSVFPLSITQRASAGLTPLGATRVTFYRTGDGGEAPYYRLGSVINNTTLALLTYADTTSDATLITAGKLYSQPGVLGTAQDKRPSPGLAQLVSYNGMLVGATGTDIWYSGQAVGGEGSWFNPIFQLPVDSDVTALAAQDGVLFVFARRAIYALSGSPPSDNGASGGLGVPQLLASDVGCIDQRSVCVTALGIFFQSERGIEVLTRARVVEWVGEKIQDTLASYPIVTAATLDAAASIVYIELAAGESAGLVTGNGRTLVYDLSLKLWVSVDRRASSTGTADTPAQSAAMVYTGTAWRYGWVATDGKAYVENRASCLDSATWVTLKAETAWFKMAGVQGYHALNRVLLLAKYATDHNLAMSFAYDYSSTYKTARTFTRAEIATVTAGLPNEQLEHGLHVDSEGQSMRIKLEDATPTGGTVGTGQGATWVALTIEGTPRQGAARLPSTSR